MKEVYKNDDELWEKICLTSRVWNVGDKLPEVQFNFSVDKLSENNVYLSNEGIKKQLEIGMEINPSRKSLHYFYYIKVPPKEIK